MVKFNKVKERILFLSPTVQAGWEDESEISDFSLTKVLGKGAFGRVSKAVHKKSQLIYAIKEINKQNLKENNMVEQVSNEVKIMYTLNHPNIIKLYNHFEDDTNIYLIQEFATGGQMYQLMWKQPGRRFQEKKVAQYILQLTQALQKCHCIGIIHRDIKPENLLVDSKGNLKLADFGWSNFLKPNANDVRDTFCGTLDYLAPEMLEKDHKHDFSVDIWAVGVLTFELSTGTSPFAPREQQFNANYVDQKTRQNIKSLTYNFPSSFPILCKEMVAKILVKDMKGRLSLDQIISHPWIQCMEISKKIKELDILKAELASWTQGQSGSSENTLQNELQIEKEKYQNLKKENDYQWGKLMESEKKVKDLQTQVQMMGTGQNSGQQEIVSQMLQYKQLYENCSAQLQQLQSSQQGSYPEQKKAQKQNIEDFISSAKQQTKPDQGAQKNQYF